jgi:copper(I)-binding protein
VKFLNSNVLHVFAAALLILMVFISASGAAELTVTGAWIRALPTAVPSGGYFNLHNGSGKTVILVGASSPACGMLMLHKTSNMDGMDGMTQMSDVAEIPVAPRETLKFSPGGYHLMCMNATPAIKPGGVVPVTLKFKNGTSLEAPFPVRSATGK